ncbi:MAG: hypothetical protein WDW38_003105 [Sanguina aurantia]
MATFVVDTSDVVGDGTTNHLQERRDAAGFFCSTSGSYFMDKESLAEHYKSDFHRYNLKRKVAGLPPVTKEWFDARKQQLAITSSAAAAVPVTKIWLDPLSKKKFLSESTFATFTRSKKYTELVRKSGAPAPEPVVYIRREEEPPAAVAAAAAPVRDLNTPAHTASGKVVGFNIKKASRGWPSVEVSLHLGISGNSGMPPAVPTPTDWAPKAVGSLTGTLARPHTLGCEIGSGPNCEAENSRIGASSGGQATSNPADGTLPHPPPAHPHPTHVCISVLVSALQAGAAQPEEEEEGSQDGWETASEASEAGEVEMEEQAAAGDEEESDHKFLPGTEQDPSTWEDWNLCRSLFDNHVSASLEANLEYMFKTVGFYFPDVEFLRDPEGLLQYLGSKLQYGLVPLYVSGDNTSAKQYRSLHAVQRHMVDTQQCKMLFDDNEEEYYDYYNYEGQDEDAEGGAGFENPVRDMRGGEQTEKRGGSRTSSKVLGSREFARYYKQGHRHVVRLDSVVINTVLAKYRALGIMAIHGEDTRDIGTKKAATLQQNRYHNWRIKTNMGVNVNASSKRANIKLPKNVTY